MPLKEINIKNFQGHRNISLKPSKGITGIIGESLAGKTGILRAIKWVSQNRPGGFRFHSDFVNKNSSTSSQLVFDDCEVKLSKTKKGATYKVKDNGHIQTFRKFKKSSMPDIAKNKINLGSINFQNQLDAHFLITSSGGKIAKAISHITQTDKIIVWIQKITKELFALKARKKFLKADIEEINAKLTCFKRLEEFDRVISKIEKLQKKKEKINSEYDKIEDLLLQIEETQKEIKLKKSYLQVKPFIKEIEELEQQLRALKQQKEMVLQAKQIQEDIKECSKIKNDYIKEYIRIIKKKRVCPTCYGNLTNKTIYRIEKEMQL